MIRAWSTPGAADCFNGLLGGARHSQGEEYARVLFGFGPPQGVSWAAGHELKCASRARVAMRKIQERPLVLVMVSECGRHDIAGFETCFEKSQRVEVALANDGNAGGKEHC